MKIKDVLNLIKFHVEKDNVNFINASVELAKDFDKDGNVEISQYIMSLLSTKNNFYEQETILYKENLKFLKNTDVKLEPLILPHNISENINGVINAIKSNIGINKFLLEGVPGTGKTEAAKQIARLSNRELLMLEFSELIDSRLGETQKNISSAFNEINNITKDVVILLDEIDIIAMDRINNNDIREMGRVTSTFLKELDNLNEKIILIATTNLFENFDKALLRRFDFIVNFNEYENEDLIEIAEKFLDLYLKRTQTLKRNVKVFRKLINMMQDVPMPGELKNLIKSSIAFSDPNDEYGYLKVMMRNIIKDKDAIKILKQNNFTLREIEILTNKSKSQLSRELRDE